MHTRICREEVNVATGDAGELWHKRLCHMSQKGMRRLADDNLISEVKNVQLEKCIDFLAGKQNGASFRTRPPMRRKAVLELVHTDVCQVDMKSHAGSQYFVTFIDDHNQNMWASPLKTKDQVMSVFKEFHMRVERETGRKPKAESGSSGQRRRIPGAVRRVLSVEGKPTRIHCVENTRAEWLD